VSRKLGEYIPLSVNYADDDAILACSPMAELLFIRCLALAGQLRSDGFLSDTQIIQRAARGLGSQRRIRVLITELVTNGPLERQDGGYVIRAWLKWNKSTDELGRERARDRERKRAERQTSNGVQPESGRTPDGIRLESERNPGLSERSPASRATARARARRAVGQGHQPEYGTTRNDTTETPAAEVINSNVEGTDPAASNGQGFNYFAADKHGQPPPAPEFEAERRRQMDALMAIAREEMS
jgi:hypothetical protein